MLDEYLLIMENNEMKATLDYIHPKVFEMVPREMLEEQIVKAFEDSAVKIRMKGFEIDKISKVLTKDDVRFARVDYHLTMSIQLVEEVEASSADDDNFMLEIYQGMYGKKNVTFDEDTNTYTMIVKTSLFAIGDPGIGSWKMIENKKGGEALLKMIIPQKIYKKIG